MEQSVSLLTAQSTSRDTWVATRNRNYDELVARLRAGELDRADMVVFNRGPRVGDLLWTGGGSFMVASHRFMTILREFGATGWTSCPADIQYRNGELLPGFEMLAITGCCGDFLQASKRRRVIEFWDGWDGSDLSWVNGESWYKCVVAERVQQELAADDLNGLEWLSMISSAGPGPPSSPTRARPENS